MLLSRDVLALFDEDTDDRPAWRPYPPKNRRNRSRAESNPPSSSRRPTSVRISSSVAGGGAGRPGRDARQSPWVIVERAPGPAWRGLATSRLLRDFCARDEIRCAGGFGIVRLTRPLASGANAATLIGSVERQKPCLIDVPFGGLRESRGGQDDARQPAPEHFRHRAARHSGRRVRTRTKSGAMRMAFVNSACARLCPQRGNLLRGFGLVERHCAAVDAVVPDDCCSLAMPAAACSRRVLVSARNLRSGDRPTRTISPTAAAAIDQYRRCRSERAAGACASSRSIGDLLFDRSNPLR